MRRWPLLLLWPMTLLAGCTAAPETPVPTGPIDAAAPTHTETATFALG